MTGDSSRPGAGGDPPWRVAEREYDDEVIGDDTLVEMFEASADRNWDSTAQLYKGDVYDRSLVGDAIRAGPPGEYEGITYAKMQAMVRRLATGFRELGVESDIRVAIFASTRMEWALSDFAVLAAEGVVSTVYTESSPRQVRYLLEDAGATGVVVENGKLLERVLAVEDELDLSFIVLMDDVGSDHEGVVARRDDIYSLADVYLTGDDRLDEEAYRSWLESRDPSDLASLIYTSGTTGQPKGVKLTHRNFRVNVNQVYRRLGPRPDKGPDLPTLNSDTRSIAFLPLAHVFERLGGHFTMFAAGATVGYAENPDTLADDIEVLSPTTGASVPRVYERIFDRMREQAGESGVKRRIFDWALGVARQWARKDRHGPILRIKHSIANRLVYSTVKESLGGNIDHMVSGGGSLSEDLCSTFIGMGLTIVEGYGLTETSPVISVNPPEDIRPGTMGVPVPDMAIRIDESVVDQTDFDDVDGPVGELLVRGPNVTSGYWNRPEANERAFVESVPVSDGGRGATVTAGSADVSKVGGPDHWFRTGDIVELTDDEYLIYHDRLKQLLVLSTGKNVAPQPIEDEFSTSDRVEQIMVVGDERPFVGALIVPGFEALRRWADREGVALSDDDAAVCESDDAREWIQAAVDAVNADLERVERIKQIALVPREWTAENDLLTPSMKKKRRNIREAFADELASIYEE